MVVVSSIIFLSDIIRLLFSWDDELTMDKLTPISQLDIDFTSKYILLKRLRIDDLAYVKLKRYPPYFWFVPHGNGIWCSLLVSFGFQEQNNLVFNIYQSFC